MANRDYRYNVEHLVEINNELGESPLWYQNSQTLFWVDIQKNLLCQYSLRTHLLKTLHLNIIPTSIAIRKTKDLLVSADKSIMAYDIEKHEFIVLKKNVFITDKMRFNDGSVDPAGRYWIGTMDYEARNPIGLLYKFNTDYSTEVMENNLVISNGIGWSPDRRKMYLTDSFFKKIYIYDYNMSNGSIDNKHVFVDSEEEEGVPDGLTVDSQGCVWSARWDGWKINRYDPNGEKILEIKLPVSRPTSCTFGGDNLNLLFITSAKMGLPNNWENEQPMAGDIFIFDAAVKGLKENEYNG